MLAKALTTITAALMTLSVFTATVSAMNLAASANPTAHANR